MKTAVPYEAGNVFQHFGHTECFKIYDIDGGKVVGGELAPTGGSGHGALAGFLNGKGVEALICGGIGGGAVDALAKAGIAVYAGVTGSADEAAKSFAEGTLVSSGEANCSHHEHKCGSHSGCGNGECL